MGTISRWQGDGLATLGEELDGRGAAVDAHLGVVHLVGEAGEQHMVVQYDAVRARAGEDDLEPVEGGRRGHDIDPARALALVDRLAGPPGGLHRDIGGHRGGDGAGEGQGRSRRDEAAGRRPRQQEIKPHRGPVDGPSGVADMARLAGAGADGRRQQPQHGRRQRHRRLSHRLEPHSIWPGARTILALLRSSRRLACSAGVCRARA